MAAGARVAVVSLTDQLVSNPPREVARQWVRGSAGGESAAIAELECHDLVILEHEFGIYAGHDGENVLRVLDALETPVISVLHTVVSHPTVNQMRIITRLLVGSARVIVMTQAAKQRLIDVYLGREDEILVIPHGAPDTSRFKCEVPAESERARPVILTWGLLGPGKGLEWAIAAMALLKDLNPKPEYRIVGRTHPKVAAHEGETYRESLKSIVNRYQLDEIVTFDSRYLATEDLFRIANQADIVLLPYDSAEQVTSGVLVEAVTAGKPVISTPFPHAVELLGSGAGIIVERQNPLAIADAVRLVITEPELSARMSAEAKRIAPEQLWSAVARRYLSVAEEVAASRYRRVAMA
jgi:glycosyltransferase involved in cell wall biosynthesis